MEALVALGSFTLILLLAVSYSRGKSSGKENALKEANKAMVKGNKQYAKISEKSRLATQRGLNSVRDFLLRKKP